jgi:hypothetical protein
VTFDFKRTRPYPERFRLIIFVSIGQSLDSKTDEHIRDINFYRDEEAVRSRLPVDLL